MVVDFMGLSSWRENVRIMIKMTIIKLTDYGQYKSVYITESVRARPWQATFNKVARDQKDLHGITKKQSFTVVYSPN